MNNIEIYDALSSKGVTYLYHANTVITSNTYLEEGYLLSRQYVENNRLNQTPQKSDKIDKKYDIWNDIFFDSIDIHQRINGDNKYGSVLFVFQLEILRDIDSEIKIIKKNPTKWTDLDTEEVRYFTSIDDIVGKFDKTVFDHMITLHDCGKISLKNYLKKIIVDKSVRDSGYLDAIRNKCETAIGNTDIIELRKD